MEAQAEIGFDSLHSIVANHEARHISLLHIEARLALEQGFHAELIRFLVALRAWSPNTWAFGGIQHTELNTGGIGIQTNRAAEGIDLSNHVALRQPTDRRITGHLPDRVRILSEQEGFAAEPRRSQRRLYACMAGPDDYDIIGFGINEVAQITGS